MNSYTESDRPAREVQEIEITPEMVEAGVDYLTCKGGDRFPPEWPIADLFVRGLLVAALSAYGESCKSHPKFGDVS